MRVGENEDCSLSRVGGGGVLQEPGSDWGTVRTDFPTEPPKAPCAWSLRLAGAGVGRSWARLGIPELPTNQSTGQA